MVEVGLRSTSERTRRARPYPTGEISYKSEWMQTGEDPTFSPTVFLYEQPGGTTLSAHFHHNNQFQIIVEGEGRIGALKVEPVMVHYAGAYTAYGPLKSLPGGLKYFTLRLVHEAGAVRVADARAGKDEWPEGPRRHAVSKPIEIVPESVSARFTTSRKEELIPLTDSGLEVCSVLLPPGTKLDTSVPPGAAGTFVFVLSGSLVGDVGPLHQFESLYVGEREEFPRLSSAGQGCHCLTLAIPQRDQAYS